jgi:hypothetical protein
VELLVSHIDIWASGVLLSNKGRPASALRSLSVFGLLFKTAALSSGDVEGWLEKFSVRPRASCARSPKFVTSLPIGDRELPFLGLPPGVAAPESVVSALAQRWTKLVAVSGSRQSGWLTVIETPPSPTGLDR